VASIGVIIPVYNKSAYLEKLAAGLRRQTFRDFCCVFVDDGSTDGSGEILDKLAGEAFETETGRTVADGGVLVLHTENHGVSAARNRGMEEACGRFCCRYLTFIDADDAIAPDYLERLFALIRRGDADLAMIGYRKVRDTGTVPAGESASDSGTVPAGEGRTGDSGTGHAGEGSTGDSGTGHAGEGSTGDSGTGHAGKGSTGDSGTGHAGDESASDAGARHNGAASGEDVILPFQDGILDRDSFYRTFARVQAETGFYGCVAAKIFPAELADGIRFDESLTLAEDLDFYLRLYRRVKNIRYEAKPGYFYLQNAENSTALTSDREIDYEAQIRILLSMKAFLTEGGAWSGENRDIIEKRIGDYAYFALFHADLEESRDAFAKVCGRIRAVCRAESIDIAKGAGPLRKLLGKAAESGSPVAIGTAKAALAGRRWLGRLRHRS